MIICLPSYRRQDARRVREMRQRAQVGGRSPHSAAVLSACCVSLEDEGMAPNWPVT